jgi:hypothetical protein
MGKQTYGDEMYINREGSIYVPSEEFSKEDMLKVAVGDLEGAMEW